MSAKMKKIHGYLIGGEAMTVILKRKHQMSLSISGIGTFESQIELDPSNLPERIKKVQEIATGLEMTLAQELLGDDFEKYMELAYGVKT